VRIHAPLSVLKYFIPDIIQDSSLSKISTDVEIVWKTHPRYQRELLGFGLLGSMP
jgi:hypothetical protein